jgi:hypothetical protein
VFVQFDIARTNNVPVLKPLFSSHFYKKKKLKHRYKEGTKERWKQKGKQGRKEEKSKGTIQQQ